MKKIKNYIHGKLVFNSTREQSVFDPSTGEEISKVIENNFNVALKCKFYPKELMPSLPKFIKDTIFIQVFDPNNYVFIFKLFHDGCIR